MGSLACLPILCHLESTISTAYVVCCARDKTGCLDNDHDVAHVLLLFHTGVRYLVVCWAWALQVKRRETQGHSIMKIIISKFQSGNHPLTWEMRLSPRPGFSWTFAIINRSIFEYRHLAEIVRDPVGRSIRAISLNLENNLLLRLHISHKVVSQVVNWVHWSNGMKTSTLIDWNVGFSWENATHYLL